MGIDCFCLEKVWWVIHVRFYKDTSFHLQKLKRFCFSMLRIIFCVYLNFKYKEK